MGQVTVPPLRSDRHSEGFPSQCWPKQCESLNVQPLRIRNTSYSKSGFAFTMP